MTITSEDFKNVAVGIGVLAGGLWALFTFQTLHQIAQAQVNLENSRLETEKLKQETFQQSVLKIDLKAKENFLAEDSYSYISGTILIDNAGNKAALLKFKDGELPISATRVILENNGRVELSDETYSQYPPKYAGFGVRAGDTQSVPFFIRLGKPGLYFVDFEVELSEGHDHMQIDANNNMSWTASKYIIVQGKPNK